MEQLYKQTCVKPSNEQKRGTNHKTISMSHSMNTFLKPKTRKEEVAIAIMREAISDAKISK